MPKSEHACTRCGTLLEGNSELCVRCFAELHRPCTACMRRLAGGRWSPIIDRETKQPLDCRCCGNERWVLPERELRRTTEDPWPI